MHYGGSCLLTFVWISFMGSTVNHCFLKHCDMREMSVSTIHFGGPIVGSYISLAALLPFR
jgi:hypothetical protein